MSPLRIHKYKGKWSINKMHPSLNQRPLKMDRTNLVTPKEDVQGLLSMNPRSSLSARTDGQTTIKIGPEHLKYAKAGIGALGAVFVILCIFAVTLVLSINEASKTMQPLGKSLLKGDLHKTVQEAHLALHSMRKLADSVPMDKVMHHWAHTNNILEKSDIPWKEIPQWRLFAQNAFRVSTDMLKQHPDWAKNIEQSTDNLKATATPLALESKEWRKSLRGASAAYAKTLMSMYKEYLDDDKNN